MNRLKRQEDEKAITLASAFREVYRGAKRQKTILWTVTFLLSSLSLLIENFNVIEPENIDPSNISTSLIFVSILNIFYSSVGNSSLIKNRHIKASQIQRKWDNYVFQMAHAPGPETIKHSEIKKHSDNWLRKNPKDLINIKHWFSENSYSIKDQFSVLAALYSSASWETELRRKYEFLLSATLITALTMLLAFSIYNNLTVENFVLTILVPAAPLLLLMVDEFFNNKRNKKDAETLQLSMTECIKSRKHQSSSFTADSYVYDWHLYRQNCSEIPNLFFKLTQKSMNRDMFFDFEEIKELLA